VDISVIRSKVPIRKKKIESTAILWFSQTGNTERVGKLMAKTLKRMGISVSCADIRNFERSKASTHDMIVIGSPVFYYNAPEFVINWIHDMPMLTGIPVASYVTFGGPEGNQHNAACSILQSLTQKEGVPIGIRSFMNMASYPLSWSEDGADINVWHHRHLPNKETYKKVREYTRHLVLVAGLGKSIEYTKKLTLREMITHMAPIWWTKKLIDNHHLSKDECIECGTCEKKCPANAINLSEFTIDTQSCVLCFGCINNCPAQAIHMQSGGKKLIGYLDFMRIHNLKITDPIEFQNDNL
jgi:ferredoxin/flavodoxin